MGVMILRTVPEIVLCGEWMELYFRTTYFIYPPPQTFSQYSIHKLCIYPHGQVDPPDPCFPQDKNWVPSTPPIGQFLEQLLSNAPLINWIFT